MQVYPHHYRAVATSGPDGDVLLESDGLDPIPSAPPMEFGGPGDRWSPETMLVAAVADCFVLSFRAIAAASKLSWVSLRCEAEGTLSRIDGTTSFTEFAVYATLEVNQEADEAKAYRILEKAEKICLITNSLSGLTHLEAVVVTVPS